MGGRGLIVPATQNFTKKIKKTFFINVNNLGPQKSKLTWLELVFKRAGTIICFEPPDVSSHVRLQVG